MHEELHAAQAAALAAGRRIASRGRDMGSVRIKGSLTDMVTDTDIAAGVAAVDSIRLAYANAAFIIEEEEVYEATGCTRGEIGRGDVWVIDPLDGTTSFVHGYPTYSVSVALLRNGTPIAGAIFNVPNGEMVSAAYGLGATSDGVDASCTAVTRLSDALLITGFPYDRGAPLDRQLEILGRFLRAPVHGIRRDGSAAVDCCHVATGRADGFWEFGLQPWDMAAGVVILREAGARVTGIQGESWTPASTGIIAANPVLHERMAHIVLEGSENTPET
jgi:myo-inositol-1(or 4)-monophosphatase